MAVQQRQWGTTPSISWTLPTEKEILQNEELTDELKRQGQYEAPGETEKKSVLCFTLSIQVILLTHHLQASSPRSAAEDCRGVCEARLPEE